MVRAFKPQKWRPSGPEAAGKYADLFRYLCWRCYQLDQVADASSCGVDALPKEATGKDTAHGFPPDLEPTGPAGPNGATGNELESVHLGSAFVGSGATECLLAPAIVIAAANSNTNPSSSVGDCTPANSTRDVAKAPGGVEALGALEPLLETPMTQAVPQHLP
jgi:hypothetical protein